MKWQRNLRLSLRAITRSWLRTLLALSGVAIGIASVVVLIGAGAGAEAALRQALEQLGRNLLVVNAARAETNALRGQGQRAETLTVADWRAIDREVGGLERTAPVAERTLLARAEGTAVAMRVHGTTAAFRLARNVPLTAGRFIDEDDSLERRRVAVVGRLVVDELFGGESPLGERLFLGGVPFRIVGVMARRGVFDGANEDEVIVVPLTTAMRRLFNVDCLDRIYVQAASEDALPTARRQITTLLRARHTARPDDFSIQDQTAVMRAQQQAGGSLSRVVIGLSALALGLGGVGLLAVSLLSVRERYPEIGLRLAVGGRPRDILLQFFTEAVLISVLGAAAGLAVGVVGIEIGSALTRWPMLLSWQAAVYPVSISVAIALVFGAYPALRAARLDPIQALHSR
jgi:putative ABC transport system permease protein